MTDDGRRASHATEPKLEAHHLSAMVSKFDIDRSARSFQGPLFLNQPISVTDSDGNRCYVRMVSKVEDADAPVSLTISLNLRHYGAEEPVHSDGFILKCPSAEYFRHARPEFFSLCSADGPDTSAG
jgi:hypothetical protein